MAKKYSVSFYKSKAWEKCRDGFIKMRYGIDGGICQKCHKEPGYIVHHKKYINESNINDPDITLNESNLEFVCKNCHEEIHHHCGREKYERRKIIFDENGNPKISDSPQFQ